MLRESETLVEYPLTCPIPSDSSEWLLLVQTTIS